MKPVAPRRPLSPFLLRAVLASTVNQDVLRRRAGWPNYPAYFVALRSATVVATPRTVARFEALADLIGFDKDELFLDEPLVKRTDAVTAEASAR